MTREEAEARCEELAAGHPDRETHQWRPREGAGGTWSIVKVAIPPVAGLTETLQAEERPPTADDPRTAHARNAGEWAGPI